MKLINAGLLADGVDHFSLHFNCTRNRKCQRRYFIPVKNLFELYFFADFLTIGQPDAIQITLFDLCNLANTGEFNDDFNDDFNVSTAAQYDVIASSYIVGQQPSGSWYGVFTGLQITEEINLKCFFLRFIFTKDGNDYVFYTEQMCINACDRLTFLRACYPNVLVGADAVDCNGIYYGFHAGEEEAVGNMESLRYFHVGYVRDGEVNPTRSKLSLTAFNSRRIYKSILTNEKVFEFELVPTFYMQSLLGIFERGNVQIGTTEYKLAAENDFQVIDQDSKLWKMDVSIDEECKQYYGCGQSDCVLPIEPCNDDVPTEATFETSEVPNSFQFTDGLNDGLGIEWVLFEICGIPITLQIDFLDAPAMGQQFDNLDQVPAWLDPTTHMYLFRWRKLCLDGQYSEWNETTFGVCEGGGGGELFECPEATSASREQPPFGSGNLQIRVDTVDPVAVDTVFNVRYRQIGETIWEGHFNYTITIGNTNNAWQTVGPVAADPTDYETEIGFCVEG